jgi:hypothetical protein
VSPWFSAPTFGQDQTSVSARVGALELKLPRAFVVHWNPGSKLPPRLDLAFTYPDSAPLGLLGFQGDVNQWALSEATARENGKQILAVAVRESARENRGMSLGPERDRLIENVCRLAGSTIQRYTEMDVEFLRCAGKEGGGVVRGYSPAYDVSFAESSPGVWRLSSFDSTHGVRIDIDGIARERLTDWKAMVQHTRDLIRSWVVQ